MNTDLAIQIFIGFVMFVIGIQLMRGKWLMLIAGYNTMGSEKRAHVNGPALGKAVGVFLLYFCVVLTATSVLPGLADFFGWFVLVPTAFLLIFVNTSSRFKQ